MTRQEAIDALYMFCESAILTRSLEQERDYDTIDEAFTVLGVTEDELAVAQGNDGL